MPVRIIVFVSPCTYMSDHVMHELRYTEKLSESGTEDEYWLILIMYIINVQGHVELKPCDP